MVFENRMSTSVTVFVLLAVVGLCACQGEGGERDRAPAQVATDTLERQSVLVGRESVSGLEALHDTVHARALRGDTLGLLRIFVRDSVYREVVWPTQPSYEPDRPEMWMLVSGMNKANSNKGLRRLLGDLADPGDLADFANEGAVKPRVPVFSRKEVAGGVVYAREKSMLVRGELSLFAAALCRDDGCQVMTYANAGFAGKPRGGGSDSEDHQVNDFSRPQAP